jgi:hypothetical protein
MRRREVFDELSRPVRLHKSRAAAPLTDAEPASVAAVLYGDGAFAGLVAAGRGS